CIGFFSLFNPLTENILAGFVMSLLIATTAFSIATINLNSLGAMWSSDYHQKTQITSWREGIALVGILIASSLPGFLQLIETRQQAFNHYSLILVLISVVSLLIFRHWYRVDRLSNQRHFTISNLTSNSDSLKDIFSRIATNKLFFLIYTVSMLASAIPAALVLFFIRDRLGAETYSGLFLFIYFFSGIIGIPVWQYLAQRFDKQISWLIGMIVAVSAFLWAYTLETNDLIEYGLICGVSGLALGAELILPPSILADLIQDNQSTDTTSSQFAMLTFLSKFCFAIASGAALLILGMSSFQTSQLNSDKALTLLSFSYALLPSIFKCVSIFLLWRWINHLRRFNNNEKKLFTADSFITGS
ncbi:MAG: MFS transporter, partial [Gammaproteobacteria bacterium]|nr:MFS transporter [Gammaproteobacteria bacterium]